MGDSPRPSGEVRADPSTRDEFDDALSELLESAQRAGVDIEGSWKCKRADGENRYWEVKITTVEVDPA